MTRGAFAMAPIPFWWRALVLTVGHGQRARQLYDLALEPTYRRCLVHTIVHVDVHMRMHMHMHMHTCTCTSYAHVHHRPNSSRFASGRGSGGERGATAVRRMLSELAGTVRNQEVWPGLA